MSYTYIEIIDKETNRVVEREDVSNESNQHASWRELLIKSRIDERKYKTRKVYSNEKLNQSQSQ